MLRRGREVSSCHKREEKTHNLCLCPVCLLLRLLPLLLLHPLSLLLLLLLLLLLGEARRFLPLLLLGFTLLLLLCLAQTGSRQPSKKLT